MVISADILDLPFFYISLCSVIVFALLPEIMASSCNDCPIFVDLAETDSCHYNTFQYPPKFANKRIAEW